MEILRIQGLCKRYGHTQALDQVSLSLSAGTICGLVGNNGAGKTTLFRILAGLVRPDAGTVRLFDATEEWQLREARRQVGFLLPRTCFQESMTPLENLVALQKLRGYTSRQEASALLDQVGLDRNYAERHRLMSLSTGEFQRCAIAGALLQQPRLLVLDEPQSGLDPATVRSFRQWMLAEKEKGTAILLSSHDLPELYQLADEYVFLDHGHVLEQISQADLDAALRRSGGTLEDYFLGLVGGAS